MATVKLNLKAPAAAAAPVRTADQQRYADAMIARQQAEDTSQAGQQVYETALQMNVNRDVAAAASQIAQADYRAAHGYAPPPTPAAAPLAAASAAGDAPTVMGVAVPGAVTDALASIKDGVHKHPAQYIAGVAGVAVLALMLRGGGKRAPAR